MDAQFEVGKLICDHIALHIDDPNTQIHTIKMAEFVPWNGELKREFITLLSKLIRLSEGRPGVATIHQKLCDLLEEGEFPEWELARKNFNFFPMEKLSFFEEATQLFVYRRQAWATFWKTN